MLKKNNKWLAIAMAFVFCLTFLAPAFVAPQTASAAMAASSVISNTVAAGAASDLGYVKVEITTPDFTSVANSELLVSFPTKIGEAKEGAAGVANVPVGVTKGAVDIAAAGMPAADGAANAAPFAYSGMKIVVPATAGNAITAADIVAPGGNILTQSGAFTVKLSGATGAGEKGWFFIYFDALNTTNYAGDVTVSLVPQAGEAFGTTPIPVVVGTVSTSGKTTTTSKSIYKVGSNGGLIDTITIFEQTTNKITGLPVGGVPAPTFTLALDTKGYKWATAAGNAAVAGLFDFSAGGGHPLLAPTITGWGTDTLIITPNITTGARNATGSISIKNLGITVDEKVARVGQDIQVKVSGGGVSEQTFTVAQYVDYMVNITPDATTELISGREGVKLGTFYVEEVAPGTLIEDRTILLELPAGVEWYTNSNKAGAPVFGTSNYEVVNNSAITINSGGLLDNRTLKLTIPTNGGSANATNGAKILFKSLKVDVSPSYKGDISVKISGKAGAEGEVKLSTVLPIITMTSDKPKVVLGIKAQKVADVVITEAKANALVDKVNAATQDLVFYLDSGFRFASVPTVEVLEGDIVLETKDVKIQAPSNSQNKLSIPIRAGSYKTPAKIKISNIMVTADRNAPVGEVLMYAAETTTTNAFNETSRANFAFDNAASVAIADNATVAPVENQNAGTSSGSGSFIIGSNIYTLNGMTKIMDVAPYIKGGRTYVPYKYLAMALGVAENDIVWDATAQTVTVTKGDKVVVATIGSTTLKVNGESTTMDVAPEIFSSRTMLPARYLAEALGAVVGWDPATRTVVFEM